MQQLFDYRWCFAALKRNRLTANVIDCKTGCKCSCRPVDFGSKTDPLADSNPKTEGTATFLPLSRFISLHFPSSNPLLQNCSRELQVFLSAAAAAEIKLLT